MIALLTSAALLSALLSALEAAILSVSRVRLEHGATKGGREAALNRMVRDPLGLLLSLSLLNTLTRLLGFGALFLVLSRWMGDWGYLAAFVAGFPAYLGFCELLPKALGRSFPYRFLLRMHWMIRSLHSIPGWFFSILTPANAAPPRPAPRDSSREEFRTRLLGLGETGILPRIAARLMCNVMGLREARVSDYCQPIGGVALRAEDPMSTLLRIQRQQEASVLPVVDASGRPVGVVDLSAALRRQDNAQSILSFVRPCPVVDPAANLESVLCRLRNPPERVALAASKGGTLRGRVSVNDLFHYVLGDECRRRNPHPEPGDEPFSSTD